MARRPDDHLNRAAAGKRESRYLEFKEYFDPLAKSAWPELIKDLIAIANSGGGVIVVGAKNNGDPSGADVRAVLELDSATIADKLERYTDEHFSDFEVHEVERAGVELAAIVIGAASTPIVFTQVGSYEVGVAGEKQKQKTAFSKGTVYVRHGAKSDPATTTDLRELIEKRIDAIREAWLGDIRRLVTAPPGSEMAVFTRRGSDELGAPKTIRLTTEPGAPVYGKLSPDHTHPHLQKDALAQINSNLPPRSRKANSYDIQAVRAALAIDEQTHPEFVHQPKYGSKQYSDAFVDWFVSEHSASDRFLRDARDRYYDLQYGT